MAAFGDVTVVTPPHAAERRRRRNFADAAAAEKTDRRAAAADQNHPARRRRQNAVGAGLYPGEVSLVTIEPGDLSHYPSTAVLKAHLAQCLPMLLV